MGLGEVGATEIVTVMIALSFTIILAIVSLIIYSNRDRHPRKLR